MLYKIQFTFFMQYIFKRIKLSLGYHTVLGFLLLLFESPRHWPGGGEDVILLDIVFTRPLSGQISLRVFHTPAYPTGCFNYTWMWSFLFYVTDGFLCLCPVCCRHDPVSEGRRSAWRGLQLSDCEGVPGPWAEWDSSGSRHLWRWASVCGSDKDISLLALQQIQGYLGSSALWTSED